MTVKTKQTLLSDHVDMRMVGADEEASLADRNDIVQLDPDHPGFRDQEYRARRNRIAEIALSYRSGQTIPDAPYTAEEHQGWGVVWSALQPAHQEHACAEYLAAVKRLNFKPPRIPQLGEVSRKVEAI